MTHEPAEECEVLVGKVGGRDSKYNLDGHDYGMEGYAVKIIDKKVVIVAGSDDALIEAFNTFVSDVFELEDDPDDLDNVVMKSKQESEYCQDDYEISSVSIDGKSVKGYKIETDLQNSLYKREAEYLQDALYKSAGIFCEIVPLTASHENAFVLRAMPKDDTPEDSFHMLYKRRKLLRRLRI